MIIYQIFSQINGQIQSCMQCNIYSQKIRNNYAFDICIYHNNNHRKLHTHVFPCILHSLYIDYIFLSIPFLLLSQIFYSTVTTFAKLRGISGFNPLDNDSSYDNSCSGIIDNIARYVWFNGILM